MLDKMRDNAQSWGIKVLFAIIILAFIFAFAGPQGGGDTVMAYVKGEPITVMEYQRALAQQDDSSAQTRLQVLAFLARSELLRQLTAEHGIVVTDEEVRGYITSMPAFQAENGGFDLARYKATVGDTEAFEASTKDELLKAKMARFLALPAMPSEAEVKSIFLWQNEKTSVQYALVPIANYLERSKVLPEEVKAYYEDNAFLFQMPERSVFQALVFTPDELAGLMDVSDAEIATFYEQFGANMVKPRTALYSEIVVPVGTTPTQESINAASDTAKQLLEELAIGSPFEALAAAYPRPGDPIPGLPKAAPVAELPKTVAQAFEDMEPGGISQPLFTQEGLTIVKLDSIEEARPLTMEEARETITARIAEEKASEALDDKVEVAIAAVTQGKTMAEAAEAAGMELTETKPMTPEDMKTAYNLDAESVQDIFAMEKGVPATVPVRLTNGYLLASRSEVLDAMTLPLSDVRGEITAKLMLEGARSLAETDAQAILAGQLEDYTLIQSGSFARSGPAPVPGADPRMIEDAFTTEPGAWLPVPYGINEGFLVAKAGPRQEPSDALWQEQRAGWLQTAGEITRRELNMSFQQHVFVSADEDGSIEVVRNDLLQ